MIMLFIKMIQYKLLGRYKEGWEKQTIIHDLYFFSCGCLWTSSLNDKHSCQLFRMGLRDKTTPTLTTPLIRANMSSVLATIFSSTANLSCLLETTFSSLRYLSNSFSSPRFNLLRVARRSFLWFSVFLLTRLILGLSFLCLQPLKICLL